MPNSANLGLHSRVVISARRGTAKSGLCTNDKLPHNRPRSKRRSGRSSAWLERLVWDQKVACSNHVAPTSRAVLSKKIGGTAFFCAFELIAFAIRDRITSRDDKSERTATPPKNLFFAFTQTRGQTGPLFPLGYL